MTRNTDPFDVATRFFMDDNGDNALRLPITDESTAYLFFAASMDTDIAARRTWSCAVSCCRRLSVVQRPEGPDAAARARCLRVLSIFGRRGGVESRRGGFLYGLVWPLQADVSRAGTDARAVA